MRIECGGIKVQLTYSPGDDGRKQGRGSREGLAGPAGELQRFSLLQFYASNWV